MVKANIIQVFLKRDAQCFPNKMGGVAGCDLFHLGNGFQRNLFLVVLRDIFGDTVDAQRTVLGGAVFPLTGNGVRAAF